MPVTLNGRSLFIAGLLFFIAYFQTRLWVGEGSFADLRAVQRELHQRSSDNDLLIARNERLAEEVRALKTGTAAIEQRARTELGMVKKNETFYLLVDENTAFKE
ncbi:MAG: septum formation initiator family protein [Gammaproteobacteria bacterium]|nr:septum formation initiator family protein [Gammaproteobacteria bacterium]